MKWISTKEQLPKPEQLVIVSLICGGYRQYHVTSVYAWSIKNGQYTFGDYVVDYWTPLKPIIDPKQ